MDWQLAKQFWLQMKLATWGIWYFHTLWRIRSLSRCLQCAGSGKSLLLQALAGKTRKDGGLKVCLICVAWASALLCRPCSMARTVLGRRLFSLALRMKLQTHVWQAQRPRYHAAELDCFCPGSLCTHSRYGAWTQVTGSVTYNGYGFHEFVPERTAGYVDQQDTHLAELTVRETFDFGARCQGAGSKPGAFPAFSQN